MQPRGRSKPISTRALRAYIRAMPQADLLLVNAAQVVPVAGGVVVPLENGAIALRNGRIAEVGPTSELQKRWQASRIVDLSGKTVVPGFVDPHTHLVYAGCRHHELEMRLAGKTYLEILEAGGGIRYTVEHTRRASRQELLEGLLQRLEIFLSQGVTTVEIKSGYGLTRDHEIKMLEVVQEARKYAVQDLVPTFLGAHVVPSEYRHRRREYVDLVIAMLPEVRDLAEFVDVFADEGAFTLEETRRILEAARDLGFGLKVHAEELAHTGASRLAAELGAVSADHLDLVTDEDLLALKEAGTVAVLLPSVTFFLFSSHYAPARKMLDLGIPVALSTDHNPGSSPAYSQIFVATLGTFLLHMTPAEVLVAITYRAAQALRRHEQIGSLEPGKRADLVILDAPSYVHLVYDLARPLVRAVFKDGKQVYGEPL